MTVTQYDVIPPFDAFDLPVSSIHSIKVKRYGNPDGIPVVYLHGGPGGGTSDDDAVYFNPERYHVVMFDQRGAGQSKPFADLRENTTWDLVADIEKIRGRLNISSWIVFGGSWGSTLALSYGVTHPDKCKAFVLRGIFLGTDAEIDHFYVSGTRKHFPELHEDFLAPIKGKTDNVIGDYYKLLTSDNATVRLEAAKAWSIWEGRVARLVTDPAGWERFAADDFATAFARIECHYFINRCFFKTPNFLIDEISKIRHLPAFIVHGRYDAICSPDIAWRLHKGWPGSRLTYIADAGHSSKEPGTRAALVGEMDRLAGLSR